jgi:hypothetical protein
LISSVGLDKAFEIVLARSAEVETVAQADYKSSGRRLQGDR